MDLCHLFGIFLLLVCLAIGHCNEIPNCKFEDTVDLTNGIQYASGAYLYGKDIRIETNQLATYDYEEIFNGQRIPREPHTRGCLCKERNCIKFCCDPKVELPLNSSRLCHRVTDSILAYDRAINVVRENGSKVYRNALYDFTVLQGIPCEKSYPLQPDEWAILENGRLLRYQDNAIFSKLEYCLVPLVASGDERVLAPLICQADNGPSTVDNVYNIAGFISIPFLILAVLLYAVRPQLRNLRGKCIICCLVSMALANTILITFTLNDIQFSQLMCHPVGSIAYFFFVSTFTWLTVIGYDLRKNSKNIITIFTEKSRFLNYSEYAWGVPLVLTTILLVIGKSNLAAEPKPVIDVNSCWLKISNWSAMAYYFGLNTMILGLNIILCFVMLCKELPYLKNSYGLKRYVRELEESIVLYSLLLLIMGISWFLKLSAYLEEVLHLKTNNMLLYMFESMSAAKGPLIFFVLLFMTSSKKRTTASTESCESPLMECGQGENDTKEPLGKYADLPAPAPIVITISNWSAMAYYFGLNTMILGLNIILCFVMLCKELPYLKNSYGLKRYVRELEESIVLYSLLLLIMGISWFLKLSAYLEEVLHLKTNNMLLYMFESMSAAKGPLIFFVLLFMTSSKKRTTASTESCESPLMECGQGENDTKEPLGKYADLPAPAPIVITSQLR